MPDVYRPPLPPNASLRTANDASEGITGIGDGVLLDCVVLISQILYLWKSIFGHSFLSMYVSYKFLFTNTSLISLSTFTMIDDNTCNYCGKNVCIFLQSKADIIGLQRWNKRGALLETNRERRKHAFRTYFQWRRGIGLDRVKLERCVIIGVRSWYPDSACISFYKKRRSEFAKKGYQYIRK